MRGGTTQPLQDLRRPLLIHAEADCLSLVTRSLFVSLVRRSAAITALREVVVSRPAFAFVFGTAKVSTWTDPRWRKHEKQGRAEAGGKPEQRPDRPGLRRIGAAPAVGRGLHARGHAGRRGLRGVCGGHLLPHVPGWAAARRKPAKLVLDMDMALWHYPRGLMAGLTGRPRSTVETPSSSARP